MTTERKEQLERWAGWGLVGVLAAFWVFDLVQIWQISNHKDLAVFLQAGERLLAGGNIYADIPIFQAKVESGMFSMVDVALVWPYAYAPLIAMLFAPLTSLSLDWVQTGWWLFNVLSLVATVALTVAALRIKLTPLRIGALLLLLHRFYPATVALRLGQIEIAQALLLAFAVYAASRRHERLVGLSLGLATATKFFPGALIALFVWQRRWRAAAWAMGTAAVLIVGSFGLVGFDKVDAYLDFSRIYGIGGAFAAFPLNQSFNGLMSRNLIPNPFTATLKGLDLPWLARSLTVMADVVVIAISAWVTWHRWPWSHDDNQEGLEDGQEQRFTLEFGMAIMAVLLVSPHSQLYAYVWALIPLTAAAFWLLDSEQPDTIAFFGVLVAAYLLIGRLYTLFVPGLTRIVQAHPLWGALLLWGLLVMLLRRTSREARERLWLE